jgi:hypothetical protein
MDKNILQLGMVLFFHFTFLYDVFWSLKWMSPIFGPNWFQNAHYIIWIGCKLYLSHWIKNEPFNSKSVLKIYYVYIVLSTKHHDRKPLSRSFPLKQIWPSFGNSIRCANIESLLWCHELGLPRANCEAWDNDHVLLKMLDWRCNLKIGRMTMCIGAC